MMDIDILLSLQAFRNGAGSFLTDFLSKMTFLTELNSAIVIMAILYWSVNKELGSYLLLGWSSNRLANGVLKVTACAYRPWIRDSRILPYGDSINTATGYCKFTDTFNQGLYTEAFCSKVANVQNHMEGVVEAEVTFDMKPFWYIDNDIEVNNSPSGREFVLQNPTGFVSYTKITVRAHLNAHRLDFSFTDNKY